MGKCRMGKCRYGYMSHGYMSPNHSDVSTQRDTTFKLSCKCSIAWTWRRFTRSWRQSHCYHTSWATHQKYGKVDFSRWKCKYLAQNQPKSMMAQWLCWGRFRLFRFQFHALLVRGLLSTGCTLNFLRKVLKLKSEKTKLNLSVCHHRLWPVLGQTFTFQGKKLNLSYFPISSAQCSTAVN